MPPFVDFTLPAPPLPAPEAECLVLVVEDDPFIARMLAGILRRAGLTPLVAATGHEAREIAACQPAGIRLAFVDCGLPDTHGGMLAAELREALPELPIVLASGRNQMLACHALARSGPTSFVGKPYLPSEVIGLLKSLLKRTANAVAA